VIDSPSMFGLFYTSVDNDGPTKQLLLEELVLEQLKWYKRGEGQEDRGWMGYPWCMQLMRSRLSMEKKKAAERTLSAIINAASVLAVETQQRRERELLEGSRTPLSSIPDIIQKLVGVFVLMETMEKISWMGPRLMSVPMRQDVIRQSDELVHIMLCFGAAPDRDQYLSDEAIDQIMAPLTESERLACQSRVRQMIDDKTLRPRQYRFDLSSEW
jgi:hypothetical protein